MAVGFWRRRAASPGRGLAWTVDLAVAQGAFPHGLVEPGTSACFPGRRGCGGLAALGPLWAGDLTSDVVRWIRLCV